VVVIDELVLGLGYGPQTFPEVDEREARRALRSQIARLERELGDALLTAFPSFGVDVRVQGSDGPRLLALGELERVRDDLADRLATVRRVLEERGAVEERNRVLLERMLLEPGRYKFARVTNKDLGEGGCVAWQVRPRLGLIGMMMGWWRVKLSSGCPLPKG
jgi:S-adenosylmethionine:diacylglycerol 3-amino-3-carboxypropyl transferase